MLECILKYAGFYVILAKGMKKRTEKDVFKAQLGASAKVFTADAKVWASI